MSVVVDQLTKVYETQSALSSLSFSIPAGQIVGLLGPNGAGKSTTMKILTCYIPQTSGNATVCGYNTLSQSLEVRRSIGYLPEHNPLYTEMYVKEYLEYSGTMYQVSNLSNRIKNMIELTDLGLEQHKKIQALSKGYRQRVGLAQAMLHNPKVLILDEPTSGLDPNQLISIRKVIQEIGREKTIIFSTHLMQEVEALCSRVLMLNRGSLVCDDSVPNLQRNFGSLEQAFHNLTQVQTN